MRYRDDDQDQGQAWAERGRAWWFRWQRRRGGRADLPQAVFKISSYCHRPGDVWQRLKSITRGGELEAEGPNGELLDQEQLEQMLEDWEEDREEGKGRRHAMRALVSFPAGVDEEKATEAARQFFREAFADNHDYAFAPTSGGDNFHVNIIVQAGGHDGYQLRIGPADIQDLRLLFAEQAHAQGIELDASPRRARGLPPAKQVSRAVEGIIRRGGRPRHPPRR